MTDKLTTAVGETEARLHHTPNTDTERADATTYIRRNRPDDADHILATLGLT